MSLTVRPGAIVAAPVEFVWEHLIQPASYSTWADARVERFEPLGPATVGQTVYLTSSALGHRWNVVFKIEKVDAVRYQFGLHTFSITTERLLVDWDQALKRT